MEILSLFTEPIMTINLIVALTFIILFIIKSYKNYKTTHFEQKYYRPSKRINIKKHLKHRKKQGYLSHSVSSSI